MCDKIFVKLGICTFLLGLVGGMCPDGWRLYDASCYHVFGTHATYHHAYRRCASHQGHLLTVKNAKENKFVTDLISSYDDDQFWIGILFNMTGRYWLDDGSPVTWTLWAGHGTIVRPACALMVRGDYWTSQNCDYLYQFICEVTLETDVKTTSPTPTASTTLTTASVPSPSTHKTSTARSTIGTLAIFSPTKPSTTFTTSLSPTTTTTAPSTKPSTTKTIAPSTKPYITTTTTPSTKPSPISLIPTTTTAPSTKPIIVTTQKSITTTFSLQRAKAAILLTPTTTTTITTSLPLLITTITSTARAAAKTTSVNTALQTTTKFIPAFVTTKVDITSSQQTTPKVTSAKAMKTSPHSAVLKTETTSHSTAKLTTKPLVRTTTPSVTFPATRAVKLLTKMTSHSTTVLQNKITTDTNPNDATHLVSTPTKTTLAEQTTTEVQEMVIVYRKTNPGKTYTDNRPSAIGIGSFGVFVLVIVLFGVFLLDASKLLQDLKMLRCNVSHFKKNVKKWTRSKRTQTHSSCTVSYDNRKFTATGF